MAIEDDPESDMRRLGGVAAIVEAATFVVGIAMFATMLSDYTTGDPTPAEAVGFVVGYQTTLFVWYLVTLLVFGVALVPLTLALHQRLRAAEAVLASIGAVFGVIWSGLVLATGMISNIGIGTVVDLADTDPDRAASVWSSIDAVTNGLGGGNELVGGMWVLLVSLAALRTASMPRALCALGVLSGVAGLITVVPGLEAVGMVFGLGLIVWFGWVGAVLLGDRRAERVATPIAD